MLPKDLIIKENNNFDLILSDSYSIVLVEEGVTSKDL